MNISNVDRQEVVDLALQGPLRDIFTLEEIGKHTTPKICRERVSQILNEEGVKKEWGLKKKAVKEKKLGLRETLLEVLRQKVVEDVGEGGEQYARTLRYTLNYFSGRKRAYPLETYFILFQEYENAKNGGEKLTLDQLAKLSGIGDVMTVRRILQSARLTPLHGTKTRHLTEELKIRVQKAMRLMPPVDIGYFSGIPSNCIGMYRYNLKKGKRIVIPCPKKPWPFGQRSLNYGLASQIYEAQDADFSTEETVELLNSKSQVVEYVKKHRPKIAPSILDVIKIFNPTQTPKVPYKTSAPQTS